MINRILYCVIVCLLIDNTLSAQEVHFADVQQMAVWYNQSLKTSSEKELKVNFRDISYQNLLGFRTGTVLVNMPLIKKTDLKENKSYFSLSGGAAFDQSNNKLYKNSIGLFGFSWSQLLSTKNLYLSAGFQGSFTNSTLSANGIYPDQFDQFGPIAGSASNDPLKIGRTFNYFSLNAGLSVFQNSENLNWYAGVSLKHINQPFTEQTKNKDYRLASTYGIQGGVKLKLEEASIDLFSLINWKADANECIGGLRYNFYLGNNTANESSVSADNIVVGAGMVYRLNDAFIPEVNLGFGKTQVGLHYDMNVSGLRTNGFVRRGFELILTQKF